MSKVTKVTKEQLLDEFEEKWCNDPPSAFLSPMCHMDDVKKLVKQIEEVEDDI